MNSTQNRKIEQVKNTTLVIGIDVGSEYHYARAFDNRGYEFSKKPFKFSNSEHGFGELLAWMLEIKERQGLDSSPQPAGIAITRFPAGFRFSGLTVPCNPD